MAELRKGRGFRARCPHDDGTTDHTAIDLQGAVDIDTLARLATEIDGVQTRALDVTSAADVDATVDAIVAEAMVLTNWELTPLEIMEKGEPWLADLILKNHSVPAG